MTMLLAAVLTLRPLEPCTAPAWTGSAGRAWLLERVNAHSAALAGALHAGGELRPYTVSSLIGVPERAPRLLTPEHTVALRVTSLSDALSDLLLGSLLPALNGMTLSLVGLPFMVEAVTTNAAQDRRAGRSSDVELVQKLTLSAAALPRNIGVRFDSPTAFKSNDKTLPFPLPALVFGSLIDRWNRFNDIKLSEEARAFAEASAALSRYELRTRYVTWERSASGASSATGFTGFARYISLQHDRYWLGVLHTLAAFAFYSGIGAHTTVGLGQARAVESRSDQP